MHRGSRKWTNMASSQCLILPRAKGRFASAASIRQRQLSSMRCKRINASRENTSLTDVHEEKLVEHECGDAEITWEDGQRVLELGVLAKGLEACSVCEEPLQLKNIVQEKRHGLGRLLYVQCECSNINAVYTGKSHRPSSSHHGLPIYDVNTKLATGKTFPYYVLFFKSYISEYYNAKIGIFKEKEKRNSLLDKLPVHR